MTVGSTSRDPWITHRRGGRLSSPSTPPKRRCFLASPQSSTTMSSLPDSDDENHTFPTLRDLCVTPNFCEKIAPDLPTSCNLEPKESDTKQTSISSVMENRFCAAANQKSEDILDSACEQSVMHASGYPGSESHARVLLKQAGDGNGGSGRSGHGITDAGSDGCRGDVNQSADSMCGCGLQYGMWTRPCEFSEGSGGGGGPKVAVPQPENAASEISRVRDQAAAAMRKYSEEISALREENDRLQAAKVAAEREATRLHRQAAADRCELEAVRAQLDAEVRRAASCQWSRPTSYEGFAGNKMDRERPNIHCRTFDSTSDESLAKSVAALELQALACTVGEERASLRRRLQAKWHPDKNTHNKRFATCVLQEIQRLSEWK